MNLETYFLVHDQARRLAAEFCATAPIGTVVEFKERKRTRDQNDKLHPMVRDIAKQVKWQRQGKLLPMTEKEWRYFFAAHIRKGAEMVPNIDGDGFIVLGVGTSELLAREASEMIELMYAFGAERNIIWSEKSKEHYERYRLKVAA